MPRVSVLIPTHNRPEVLRRCLDAVAVRGHGCRWRGSRAERIEKRAGVQAARRVPDAELRRRGFVTRLPTAIREEPRLRRT